MYGNKTLGDVVNAEFVDLVLYLEGAVPPIFIIPVKPNVEEWKSKKLFIEWISFNIYYPTLASPIQVGDCVTRQLCTFPEFLKEREVEDADPSYVGSPSVHGIFTKKNFFDQLAR